MSAASAMSRRKPVSREAIVQPPTKKILRYIASGLAGFAAPRQKSGRNIACTDDRHDKADAGAKPAARSKLLFAAQRLRHATRRRVLVSSLVFSIAWAPYCATPKHCPPWHRRRARPPARPGRFFQDFGKEFQADGDANPRKKEA